jgi:hypothetical protein
MKRTALLIFVLLPSLLILTACPRLEVTARDGIATAKGFIEDQQTQHKAECTAATAKKPQACDLITQAVAAQNLAIDALELYCADPAFVTQHGTCHPTKEYQAKLQLALQNLDHTLASVKALAKP